MELSYWQSRWRKGNTGFHLDEVYDGLKYGFSHLDLPDSPAVLVPLCGKSLDLIWLSEKCFKVIGVETSEIAIQQFFCRHSLEYSMQNFGTFTVYKSNNLELWCGDFLKIPPKKVDPIHLIYDKAAIVALPKRMRPAYSEKLKEFCNNNTQILMQYFTYPQDEMNGPPFSVPSEEISAYFEPDFQIQTLKKENLRLQYYQKFQKRGLKSQLIEYLLLLSKKERRF